MRSFTGDGSHIKYAVGARGIRFSRFLLFFFFSSACFSARRIFERLEPPRGELLTQVHFIDTYLMKESIDRAYDYDTQFTLQVHKLFCL